MLTINSHHSQASCNQLKIWHTDRRNIDTSTDKKICFAFKCIITKIAKTNSKNLCNATENCQQVFSMRRESIYRETSLANALFLLPHPLKQAAKNHLNTFIARIVPINFQWELLMNLWKTRLRKSEKDTNYEGFQNLIFWNPLLMLIDSTSQWSVQDTNKCDLQC